MSVGDLTLYTMVERTVLFHGEKTALVEDDRRITYAQLKKMVDSLSIGLIETEGVHAGDRIGVLAANSVEYMVLYLAAARIGAILVPINFRLSPEEIAFIVEDTKPVLLFVQPEFQEVLDGLGGRLSSVRGLYSTAQGEGVCKSWQALMGSEETPDLEEDIGTDTPLVIFYTAATTGKPRGAVLTQGNIIASVTQLSSTDGLSFCNKDVFLAFLPFSHVYGLVAAVGMLQVGGTNIIQKRFDPESAVELMLEENVTVFFSFPPILKSILDVVSEKNAPLPHLRLVSGLEVPEIIEKLEDVTQAKFWATYGQGETSGPVTFSPFDGRPGLAGRAAPLAHIGLVDARDNPVPEGDWGEIVVRGPLVFKGYWGLEETTDHALRNGWHHTGDVGQFEEDGYLFYRGRTAEKELIKTGGENVYPAEVERAALMHPSVSEAVVFGVPHAKWGEGIKLVCVLKPGETVDTEELIQFVGNQIARYKKPHFVTFVDALPNTPSGEIDREQVKAEHQNS